MSNAKAVRSFFDAIEAFEDVMVPTVSYISWVRNGVRIAIKARVRLGLRGVDFESRIFEWQDVVAETYKLDEIGKSVYDLVHDVLSGKMTTPHEEISFPSSFGDSYVATYLPLHPEGIEQQNRITVLQIRGETAVPLNYAPIDWDLRAANPPYDSLTELAQEFGLGALTDPDCLFEVIATDVVAMDFSSRVDGTSIDLAIFAAPGLDTQEVSIGYRVFDKGKVVERKVLSGDTLRWETANGTQRGNSVINVPPAAVIHCYANYRGVTHGHRWFNDPTVAQNSRRATYERFDQNLDVLREMCVPKDVRYARDLEFAVGCILWMLGFNCLHIGNTKRLQDGPDLLATTPSGHFLVVECTTGQIKGESKLERLVSRAASVRERLLHSNDHYSKVLPIMVTSMTRAEISAGIGPAREHGVVVLAREEIFAAIDRTLVLPQPDEIYSEAERSLESL